MKKRNWFVFCFHNKKIYQFIVLTVLLYLNLFFCQLSFASASSDFYPSDFIKRQSDQFQIVSDRYIGLINQRNLLKSPSIGGLNKIFVTEGGNSFVNLIQGILLSRYIYNFLLLLMSVLPVILIGSLMVITLYSLFKLLILLNDINDKKVFLSIKFPANANQEGYSTEHLVKVLHTLLGQLRKKSIWSRLGQKGKLSLEIVSTSDKGIRYIIGINEKDVSIAERIFISYLSGVQIEVVSDYVQDTVDKRDLEYAEIAEFCLSNHFSLPLKDQKSLDQVDPIAYLTGQMTKLSLNEIISIQFVISPLNTKLKNNLSKTISDLEDRIWNGYDIKDIIEHKSIRKVIFSFVFKVFTGIFLLTFFLFLFPIGVLMYLTGNSESVFLKVAFKNKYKRVVGNARGESLYQDIQDKIEGPLYETTVRLLIKLRNKESLEERKIGFISALSTLSNPSIQSLVLSRDFTNILWYLLNKITNRDVLYSFCFFKYKNRLLSFRSNKNPILSVSELADLYHFPYTSTTKTENLVKLKSPELPAPLFLKKPKRRVEVVLGRNTYGSEETVIGLSKEERDEHVYVIGKTNMGKSTMFANMIYQDIVDGRGVAVIDPHGELIDTLLGTIPKERIKDVVYFNPVDTKFPIGLNLLELGYSLDNDSLDYQKDLIKSSLISFFKKLYPPQYSGPRMEYILRNLCNTAWETKDPTIFTLQRLLNDVKYQKEVVGSLSDELLKRFWTGEFQKLGDYQVQEYISPIVNKIGRFQEISMSKHVLGQTKSKIDFNEIVNSGKILLCNLSLGKLGEDNTQMFGILVLLKLQIAAMQRANIPPKIRQDFHLYVDEFQTFATPLFGQILSGARKYKFKAHLAHQSTAQIEDNNLVRIIIANAGVFIVFRTADPVDERLFLPIFSPEVEKNQILNLPSHHFYMKVNTRDAEDAFSGETLDFKVKPNKRVEEMVVESSRKLYGRDKEDVANEISYNLTSPFIKREDSEKRYRDLLNIRRNELNE